MAEQHIKLKRQLLDLFQHCEVRCRANCCEWLAFDLSDHWLKRWCEFNGADAIDHALEELADLDIELAGRDAQDTIALDRFFHPTIEALTTQLGNIKGILIACRHSMSRMN